jgi:transcriptional regulator with XRE-family HTH domain
MLRDPKQLHRLDVDEVARRVRHVRAFAKLSGRALSRTVGGHKQLISRIENAQAANPYGMLEPIAHACAGHEDLEQVSVDTVLDYLQGRLSLEEFARIVELQLRGRDSNPQPSGIGHLYLVPGFADFPSKATIGPSEESQCG